MMDELPDDVLALVFEYVGPREVLRVCSKVSRRWLAVAERRALTVRCAGDEQRVHRALRALMVLGPPPVLRAALRAAPDAPLLRELTVHAAAPVHCHQLGDLARLPNLRHLDVFAHPPVLDANLLPVARRLTSIVANESIAPGTLRQWSADCRLEAFHMFGRCQFYPYVELLPLLRVRSQHLRELTLRCTELMDSAYEVIGSCVNLRSLQLYSCWLLTSAGCPYVVRPTRLRKFHLTGARLVRTQAIASLVSRLPPDVTELVLSTSWFGDEHVDALVGRLPRLQVLEMWRCRLSSEGAVRLADALTDLRTFDLDLRLSLAQLQKLASHPSLEVIRCMPEEGSGKFDFPRRLDKLCIIQAGARYGRKFFRSGGEGYRSSLFYSWMQDTELQPLPYNIQPCFDDDDEFY